MFDEKDKTKISGFIKPKKKTDIVKMNFPVKKIYNLTGSLQHSKLITAAYSHFPEEDQPRQGSDIAKVNARRDLNIAEQRLTARRIEAREASKQLKKKWEELRLNEESLRALFKKFNEFFRENQEKRERAQKKIQDERNLQAERVNNTTKLKEQMDYNQKIYVMMIKKIKEYRLYEDFLGTVVRETVDFKNVPAVLNRFQALVEAKQTSAKKQEEQICAFEKTQYDLVRLHEEKSTHLMGLRSRAASLHNRFEVARHNSLTWENTLTDVNARLLNEYAQSKAFLRSSKALYKQMCARKLTLPGKVDMENRMEYVKHTLTQLDWLRNVRFAAHITSTAAALQQDMPYHDVMKLIKQRAVSIPVKREKRGSLWADSNSSTKSAMSVFAYLLYEKPNAHKTVAKRKRKSLTTKFKL